jgi:hypothetical protein
VDLPQTHATGSARKDNRWHASTTSLLENMLPCGRSIALHVQLKRVCSVMQRLAEPLAAYLVGDVSA